GPRWTGRSLSAAPTREHAAHCLRDGSIARRAGREAFDGALDVRIGAVLAELGLGLEAGDPQLETDDRAGLRSDVVLGRISECPWMLAAGLVAGDQPPDVRDQPVG